MAESEHQIKMKIELTSFGNEEKVILNAVATLTRILVRVFGNRVKIWYTDPFEVDIPVRYDETVKVSSWRTVQGQRVVSIGDR